MIGRRFLWARTNDLDINERAMSRMTLSKRARDLYLDSVRVEYWRLTRIPEYSRQYYSG